MTKKLQPNHVIGGLLVLGIMSCSGPPPADLFFDRTNAEAKIREIENACAQVAVSGDPANIGRIFADDFVGVASDGTHYTMQGFIDDTKAHPLGFTSTELKEVKLRFV
jgi:Domain of unknown function (DUF4440)